MRLSEPYNDQNVFALILKGEAPAHIVYEDDGALAFLDVFPQCEGHTLVIPKGVKAKNLLDMPQEKLGDYMLSVQKVARAVFRAFNADGIEIFQFNGAAAGQTVFHLHFHILPRFEGKSILAHNKTSRADDKILAQTAARIRTGF